MRLQAGDAPQLTSSSPCFTGQLLALAAQQGRLQALTLHHTLPREQHPLLRSLASLSSLALHKNSPALLGHLRPQLTAHTFAAPLEGGGGSCAASTSTSTSTSSCAAERRKQQLGAAAAPQLRRLCTDAPEAVLSALPLAQLAGLTSLTGNGEPGATLQPLSRRAAASVSCLAELVELHCRPWRGVVRQLGALRRLRRLKLELMHAGEVAVMEAEVPHLAHLAQLRQLVLGSCYEVH
jgi:hypothetical protein